MPRFNTLEQQTMQRVVRAKLVEVTLSCICTDEHSSATGRAVVDTQQVMFRLYMVYAQLKFDNFKDVKY